MTVVTPTEQRLPGPLPVCPRHKGPMRPAAIRDFESGMTSLFWRGLGCGCITESVPLPDEWAANLGVGRVARRAIVSGA